MDTPANSNYNAQAEEQTDGFIAFSLRDNIVVNAKNLNRSDRHVWLFLLFNFPFADYIPNDGTTFTKIPKSSDIADNLGISEPIVKASIRKLKRLGLLLDTTQQNRQ